MSRYTVRGPIEGKFDDYYVMEDGEEMTFFDLQAQAEICAFALNAVADGHTLYAGDEDAVYSLPSYEGPTEGVAPHG